MKIVVTGTRGIPNIMGGVETHCEELYRNQTEKLCKRLSYRMERREIGGCRKSEEKIV